MIRSTIKNCYLISFTLPFNLIRDADVVSKDLKTVKEADLSVVQQETGWERVKSVFKKDAFGRVSPEVNSVLQTGCLSTVLGMLYGGVVNSREAYMDFMKNNQASLFQNHLEAKRKLQDQISVSFAKGAFKWGWRLTLFSTTYVTATTTIAAYRGKNGVLEHVIAGATSGFLYKFQMGPRGWIVGAGLGVVLGTVAGVFTSSLLKFTGMTMEEVRYWNYKWTESRSKVFQEGYKKYSKKELQLLRDHDEQLETPQVLGEINLDESKKTK